MSDKKLLLVSVLVGPLVGGLLTLLIVVAAFVPEALTAPDALLSSLTVGGLASAVLVYFLGAYVYGIVPALWNGIGLVAIRRASVDLTWMTVLLTVFLNSIALHYFGVLFLGMWGLSGSATAHPFTLSAFLSSLSFAGFCTVCAAVVWCIRHRIGWLDAAPQQSDAIAGEPKL